MVEKTISDGFKEIETGIIPTDWDVKRIDEVFEFLDGKRKPIEKSIREKMSGEYPYYGASGIIDYVNDFIFDNDLILLGEDGENIISRNTRLAFKISGKCWINNHAHVLKPLNGNNITFLSELLENINYEKYNTGTAQPKLNKTICSKIQLRIPPIPEQEKIAQIIFDIDELIEQLECLIEKKKNIKQGVMQELLTGGKRLEGFSTKWDNKLLGDMLDYEQPTKYLVKNTEYDDRYNVPVLTAGKTFILGYTNEENNIFQNLPVIIFDDFTTSSKYVDFSFKAKSSAMKILKVKNERVNLKFIYERMQLINFPLGNHKRHWISEFSNLLIKVPEYKEQNKIEQILSDMDMEIKELDTQKIKYIMIKQGMIQKLLTGEIRLK